MTIKLSNHITDDILNENTKLYYSLERFFNDGNNSGTVVQRLYSSYYIKYSDIFSYSETCPYIVLWNEGDYLKFLFKENVLLKDVFFSLKIFELTIKNKIDENYKINFNIEKSSSLNIWVANLKINKEKLKMLRRQNQKKYLYPDLVLEQIDFMAPDNFYKPIFFIKNFFKEDGSLKSGSSLRDVEKYIALSLVYESSYSGKKTNEIILGTFGFDYHLSEIRGFFISETNMEFTLAQWIKGKLESIETKELEINLKNCLLRNKDRVDNYLK